MIWSKYPYTENFIHCYGVVDDENRANVSIGKNNQFIYIIIYNIYIYIYIYI